MTRTLPTTLSILLLVWPNFTPIASALPQNGSGAATEIHYKMFPVRDTKIQFPRLTGYKDLATMNQVNAQIDGITKGFRCREPRNKNDWYEVSSRVEYASQDIFSIYASANYYCGGPYPTGEANLSVTFDLRTGKTVSFFGLFRNYEANKDSILRIIFARELARTEALLAAGKKSGENCDDDPRLFTLEVLRDSEYAYNFSEKGLVVRPLWAHVIQACAERVTVPYKELKGLAATDSILARAIE